jgi:hypothetical protein
MAWNGFDGLDLSKVEAESGRKTLEPGSHPCTITEAALSQTKDKAGHGLIVTFTSKNGAGVVEDFINLNNRNPMAVEIGMKRLKGLLIAAKHPNPDRPSDVRALVGLSVGVHVVQGSEWTDKDGKVRPGGGKPRQSGAYYPVDGGASSGGGYTSYMGNLDDDIPF